MLPVRAEHQWPNGSLELDVLINDDDAPRLDRYMGAFPAALHALG